MNHIILYEISKLLPHSNLTDVCLDNTHFTQNNYDILLELSSHLRYLSLRRCNVNYKICSNIAANLSVGCLGGNLYALDLTSNNIGDLGAKSLGIALRSNRTLSYLNISDNKITDEGAAFIIEALMEFRLTREEIIEKRKRFFKWYKMRQEVFAKCLTDALAEAEVKYKSRQEKKSNRRRSTLIDQQSPNELAEMKTNLIVGTITDPFTPEHTFIRDGNVYCFGNLKVSYLNLAFNNIEYFSIRKILDVLRYQHIHKDIGTGIIKITIDGNRILQNFRERDEICNLLKDNYTLEIMKQKKKEKKAPKSEFSII